MSCDRIERRAVADGALFAYDQSTHVDVQSRRVAVVRDRTIAFQRIAVVNGRDRTISTVEASHRPPVAGYRESARAPALPPVAPMMFNERSFVVSGTALTRSPPHRLLAHVLESDSQLAGWSARLRQEAAVTARLRKHLPRPIADRVRVTDVRNGVLELAASGGAIAVALRQRALALRSALAREGCDFDEIRVRVQVAGQPQALPASRHRQWDSASAAPLFDLADRLPEGPLKAVLARWSRRARGR